MAAQRTRLTSRTRAGTFGKPAEAMRSKGRGSDGEKEDAMSLMRNLGSVSLLTAAEEVELARHIQDLLELERTQAALSAELGRPPSAEEWAAAVGMTVPAFEVRLPSCLASPARYCGRLTAWLSRTV